MYSYTDQHQAELLQNGFLPEFNTYPYLVDEYYQPWEILIKDLPILIRSQQFRRVIKHLPLLATRRLKGEAEWRRAYVILSFLTHAFLWCEGVPADRLPSAITIPYLSVSHYLGIPPTATYAATALWNFSYSNPNVDLTIPENVHILQTFTGTLDEEWFYTISVSIEARGAQVLPKMLECFDAVRHDRMEAILSCLEEVKHCINDLAQILERMYERCQPEVFYHQIRPFLAGSKGMTGAGLPRGVFYDEGNGNGDWRQYSGGSNAQSSLIQLLDIVLGVAHFASGGNDAKSKAPAVKSKHGYIEEMRNYMPGPHRSFLLQIADIANIREYAMHEGCDLEVRAAYQAAVASLTAFRDKHIQIVTRYIIAPSRQGSSGRAHEISLNIATASTKAAHDGMSGPAELSGTGGTLLMPFLKQTRDETRKAAVAG